MPKFRIGDKVVPYRKAFIPKDSEMNDNNWNIVTRGAFDKIGEVSGVDTYNQKLINSSYMYNIRFKENVSSVEDDEEFSYWFLEEQLRLVKPKLKKFLQEFNKQTNNKGDKK